MAGLVDIYLSNGQIMKVFATALTAGVNAQTNLEGAAVATSSNEFSVRSDCCVKDIIVDAGTAGQMEIYNVDKSQRGGKFIDLIAATYIVTNPARPIPKICFRAGTLYRWIMTVTQA
jgi:hypothetical protein